MLTALDPQIQEELKKEDLRYSTDRSPGFFRQKYGKSFKYYDLQGNLIRDDKTLDRIDSLAIPPAWKNVWVCSKANGHLQATGIDERKRKQYIYHPDWIKICQQNKFSKLTDFGMNLPIIRHRVALDMENKKMDKRKIVATIIWLLEHTFIRIGNEEYSKENNSFGLTTFRNKHVKVRGSDICFSFRGKSGVFHTITITNNTVAKTIKRCIELPGYELFQFFDEHSNRHVVDSSDVNMFLKEVTKDDFSAKDFRTWGASHLCAKYFYKQGLAAGATKTGALEDPKLLKKVVVDTVKKVAGHLNNTVSVCRNYYIHPTVIDSYEKRMLVPHFMNHKKGKEKKRGLTWEELALIKLLEKYPQLKK